MFLVTRQGLLCGVFGTRLKMWQAVEAVVGVKISTTLEEASAVVVASASLGVNYGGREIPLTLSNLGKAFDNGIGVMPFVGSATGTSRLCEAPDLKSFVSGFAEIKFLEKKKGVDQGTLVTAAVYEARPDTMLDYRLSANSLRVTALPYEQDQAETKARAEAVADLPVVAAVPVSMPMGDLEFAERYGKKSKSKRGADDNDSESDVPGSGGRVKSAPKPRDKPTPTPSKSKPSPAPDKPKIEPESAATTDKTKPLSFEQAAALFGGCKKERRIK